MKKTCKCFLAMHLQKKNYAAAIKYFTMASQIPHDAMAKTLYNMGFTFQNDNKIQKALKYYNKAIEQDSDFMQAHLKAAFLCGTLLSPTPVRFWALCFILIFLLH